MKVKKLLVAALLLTAAVSYGQNNNYIGQDYRVSPNVITTAVPFVSIAPDARGGALGDCGVASDPDVYSMHYNTAKYVYLEDKLSVGLPENTISSPSSTSSLPTKPSPTRALAPTTPTMKMLVSSSHLVSVASTFSLTK